jgi:hypothetical protein
MVLYRPVGLEELLLVFASGMKAFPPRLPEQPIFYPVMNERYAAQIAREWNTKSSAFAGYVTCFSVKDAYAASLPVRTVGAREHRELWVPAEKLEELNAHIEGHVEVIDAFFGDGFKGMIPQRFALRGKDAIAQLVSLHGIHSYSLMDFHGEIAANKEAVFVHFPLWKLRSFVEEGVSDAQRETLLNAIRKAWSEVSPEIPLPDF